MANVFRGAASVPVRPTDVMPYYDPFEEEITPEELGERISGALARARGLTLVA